MTQYVDWSKRINKQELTHCADIINNNELVVFPTETVYGIGANALNEEAVKKIYAAKGRPSDNPLIVHVHNKNQIKKYCVISNNIEKKLINAFMPGPFTLVLGKKNNIPNAVTARLNTVAIRVPKNKIANAILKKCQVPIAAPSANVSGKPSGTSASDVREELEEKVGMIIDGGNIEFGLESTVVKVINNVPVILRPGIITAEDIKKKIGYVKIDEKIFKEVEKNEKVESPGVKYKHYSPQTMCVLVDIEDELEQIKSINSLLREHENACVLGFDQHRELIRTDKFISLGNRNNLKEISQNLYKKLREIDALGVDIAFIEGVTKEKIGLAIMNRLIRACGYNKIQM
jgi:L-threonylcarbamoyladenylate synthase